MRLIIETNTHTQTQKKSKEKTNKEIFCICQSFGQTTNTELKLHYRMEWMLIGFPRFRNLLRRSKLWKREEKERWGNKNLMKKRRWGECKRAALRRKSRKSKDTVTVKLHSNQRWLFLGLGAKSNERAAED